MEAYPLAYVRHELPLIALSGLGEINEPSTDSSTTEWTPLPGVTIARELPDLTVSFARALRDEFYGTDGSSFPSNGSGNRQRPGLIGFKFSSVGRNLVFPRRKAAPAAQTPSEEPSSPPPTNITANTELHSTLSPLSPTSPLFPDGLLSPFWMKKHQQDVPSVLLCFFELTADPATGSLQDNHLKNEINRIKTALSRSGYRTRLAVAVVSDEDDEAIDDRISGIRRATGLDSKSSFFFLTQPRAQSELVTFALNTLAALQPVCVDYYRDLTKHSRRKKNRGYIPAPTGSTARGTSQSLSTSGWHARYDFKQGVFAEFRQEMDVAERHFASTLEELFNAEGVLETTPIWSSRWEEARCLADITALRVLRCQLWRSMTSGAAESWSNYRDRTRALVDRRGKGSGTYGYAAWESRWAQIMAELIARSSIPAFEIKQASSDESGEEADEYVVINISAPAEKAYATVERLTPFHFLHHPGYWYRMAQRWAVERYRRVKALPQDERAPPEQIQRSQDAERTKSLDTYMVSPPHEELPAEFSFNKKVQSQIMDLGEKAEREFELRKQFRMKSLLAMQRAHVLSENGSNEKAIQVLLSLWTDMSWRTEGWWDLAGEVMLNLYKLAEEVGEHRISTEVKWELLCKVFQKPYSKIARGSPPPRQENSMPLTLDRKMRLSPVSVSFCFAYDESHVGDVIPCQISITSTAIDLGSSLQIQSLRLSLNGGLWQIHISHNETDAIHLSQDLLLKDNTSTEDTATRILESQADLRLGSGGTHIFNFRLALRDVGELAATEVCLEASLDAFTIRCTHHQAHLATSRWLLADGKGLVERSLDRPDALGIEVLPKPPRVELRLSDPRSQYFTSEDVTLELVLVNEENEAVEGSIKVDAAAEILDSLGLQWEDNESSAKDGLPSMTISHVKSFDQAIYKLSFRTPSEPASLALPFNIDYTVGDDKDTTSSKTATFSFDFVRPIDAVFDLAPRLDTKTWPSFFALPPTGDFGQHMEGVRQRWMLQASISSLSHEPLSILSIALAISTTPETIHCFIPTPATPDTAITLSPSSTQTYLLPFHTTRRALDDRRPAPLSLHLSITWRRLSSNQEATTLIPVPTMHIPPAEPRVLCTASALPYIPHSRLVTYTIENPSLHFLTFSLTLEAADSFAFAGAKVRNVALTPLSRMAVEYRVMLLDGSEGEKWKDEVEEGSDLGKGERGRWIYPVLRVTDSYFNKTLRVVPAGSGVGSDDRE
ncbi:hypothetical protein K461DRAFT_240474, partial [Myriangium duriaei CBS 260.36]